MVRTISRQLNAEKFIYTNKQLAMLEAAKFLFQRHFIYTQIPDGTARVGTCNDIPCFVFLVYVFCSLSRTY
jgi:hypothetical protein